MATAQPDSQHDTIVIEDESLREGFTQIPNAILRRSDVSAGAKLTYMALLSHAWQKDRCFPGQDVLAEELGAGRRSVVRYLQELQQVGLLQIKRRGLGLTNVYILTRAGTTRSANLAHQEVPKRTHQEVPKRHTEEYSSKKTKNEKDISIRIDAGAHEDTAAGGRGSPQPGMPEKPPPRPRGQFEPLAATISAYQPPLPAQQPSVDDRSLLAHLLAPYRSEFGDTASSRASTSRILKLFAAEDIGADAFAHLLAEAAARTRESQRLGTIEGSGFAYFISVLDHLLQPTLLPPATVPQTPQNGPQQTTQAKTAAFPSVPDQPATAPAEGRAEAIEETDPAWKAVLTDMRFILTEANFRTWLLPTRVISRDGTTLTIRVPNQFHADWLTMKLHDRLHQALQRAGHGGLQLAFIVAEGG